MKRVVTLTSHRVWLNIRSLITQPLTAILLFILPTLFCASGTVIAPVTYHLGMMISAVVAICSIVTYGTVAGSFRRSTLNVNSNLTIAVRWIDNLATLFTLLIMSMVMLTYVLSVFTLFDYLGILLVTTSRYSELHSVDFANSIDWISIYYNALLVSILTFSLCYLYQGFFDSDIMFYVLAVVVLILLMLLGSSINNYFYLSNRMYWDPMYMGDGGTTIVFYDNVTPFGKSGYFISLLFPYYAPSQIMHLSGDAYRYSDFDSNVVWTFFDTMRHNSDMVEQSGISGWRWNILYFMPYIHIAFWWSIGFIYKLSTGKIILGLHKSEITNFNYKNREEDDRIKISDQSSIVRAVDRI